MVYFDNAATSVPKPPEVAEAVFRAINNFGNPSRGAHEPALNALRCMLDARAAASEMFGVCNPMRVVFTLNATAALNIAINGIRGHIVTTAAEHNSVLRPLYRRGNFTVVPLDPFGRLDINSLEKEIRHDTEAVVLCHASNLTGNVFDIGTVGEICRSKGIKFIVDAAQTAGLIKIDIKKAGISALCASGHKSLYGPQGTGIMCLCENYNPPPLIVGGSGHDSYSTTHPGEMPDALEAGTQNASGVAGLLAGLNYVKSLGRRIFVDADRLARMFVESINDNKKIVLYGDFTAKLRTPVVALNIKNMDNGMVAALLFERYGIAVRAGVHCAPLMHKTLNSGGAVRFSFSHFNTEEEVKKAVKALEEISQSAR